MLFLVSEDIRSHDRIPCLAMAFLTVLSTYFFIAVSLCCACEVILESRSRTVFWNTVCSSSRSEKPGSDNSPATDLYTSRSALVRSSNSVACELLDPYRSIKGHI
jgi:hypothetical protein